MGLYATCYHILTELIKAQKRLSINGQFHLSLYLLEYLFSLEDYFSAD